MCRLVLSTNAGPNGPATVSANKDLAALLSEPDLYAAIDELSFKYGGPDIRQYAPEFGKFQHSKIVALSDKAGKTRVVAIADWWSNVALSSLHDTFMSGLKKMRSDLTFRQSDLGQLVKSLPKTLYSADMTAFTDRLPTDLCVMVIKAAYGASVGELWKTITTKRTFKSPIGDLSYECGNPMGLLSSWPISAFTHHAIKE